MCIRDRYYSTRLEDLVGCVRPFVLTAKRKVTGLTSWMAGDRPSAGARQIDDLNREPGESRSFYLGIVIYSRQKFQVEAARRMRMTYYVEC